MKSVMVKAVLALSLTLMALSAHANWRCKIHNLKGQVWYGIGPTRAAAAKSATGLCMPSTNNPVNCILDVCVAGNFGPASPPAPPPAATWQCNVVNNRGQAWYGLGANRKIAAMNAIGFCAGKGSSAYARNCHITTCFVRH